MSNTKIIYLESYIKLRKLQIEEGLIGNKDKTLEAIAQGRINELEMLLEEIKFTKKELE